MVMDQRDRVSILTATVARLTRVRFDQRARPLGLTRPQWQTLTCILFYEGSTVSQVAEMIEVEAITAGRLIDGLESMKLVERRLNAGDRRLRHIHLTPSAKPLIVQLRTLSTETEAELYTGLSDSDLDTLERLLNRVRTNLSSSLGRDRHTVSEVPRHGEGAPMDVRKEARI